MVLTAKIKMKILNYFAQDLSTSHVMSSPAPSEGSAGPDGDGGTVELQLVVTTLHLLRQSPFLPV